MRKFKVLSIILVCIFLATPVQADPTSTRKSLITYGLGAAGAGLVLPFRGVTTPFIVMLPWFVLKTGEMMMHQRNRS